MVLIVAIAMSLSLLAVPAKATTARGPRIDELLCKIYMGSAAEFAAFEASDIDLVDSPLGKAEVDKWSMPPYSDTIILDPFRGLGMYEFDINNNQTIALSYPNLQSPTYDLNFRHAIAHLVDKPYIINAYVGGYGAQLESPFMPWLRWYDPTMTTHAYDPYMTCQILNDNGWRSSPDPNVVTDVHFPATWPVIPGGPNVAGSNLKDVLVNGPHGASDPGLIFYRRSDHQPRSLAGDLLIYGDATNKGLESIGIPCDDNNVVSSVSYNPVTVQKNFHIYTGGWSFGSDPDYACDIWSSWSMNWGTEFAANYDNIQDPVWNSAVQNIKYARNLDDAETAAHAACQRFGEQVLFIPIWTTVGYMAHKTAWHALNADPYGVSSWWNLYCTNNPAIGVTGGQLRWGFASDINQLNVIYSNTARDWQILDKIYDTLTTFNPLNSATDMPWMASGWTIGTWTNPDTGMTASKINFTLRTDIKWINPLTGTVNSAVTPEDVKFSFQYVYDHVGWNYASVADLFRNPDGALKIEISGNTITFYETIQSVWTFHWLGGLPIIPKTVYEGIADPHGFTPGGLPLATVLVGSGAFYFQSYTTGISALLETNRNYFKTIVPNTDTDPTHIHIDWGIFKSNVKSGDWTVNVLDLIRVARKFGQAGFPPGSIPEDINKDGKINILDIILVVVNIDATWP